MKMVTTMIGLVLALPASAELLLGDVLALDNTSADASKRVMAAYFNGYADALMATTALHSVSVGLDQQAGVRAAAQMYSCFRNENVSITYARLLVSARDQPERPVRLWTLDFWQENCAAEIAQLKQKASGDTQ